jgi:hypothetical protein
MTMSHTRAGLIAGIAALIGAAACNRSSSVADDGLKRDLAAAGSSGLELAPSTARPQMIVSPIEAGPGSAPKRAAPRRAPSPSPRATVRVAAKHTPARAPAPSPITNEAAPVASAPAAEPAPAPTPRPSPAPSQDRRVYKTEAQIFRDMPWIRP